jgi:hypothetical protein
MLTEEQIADALNTVNAMAALEACPGWSWMLDDLKAKRDGLQRRVSDQEIFAPNEDREKVRYGYKVLRQLIDDFETTYQLALNILAQTDKLPGHLHDRLKQAPQPVETDPEIFNPFAQISASIKEIFGNPPPPPKS